MNRMHRGALPLIALFALLTPAAPGFAQAEAPGAPSEMSAEERAAMAAYERAATPGEAHAWLASTAGSWSFSGAFWTAPGAEPTRSTGTAVRTALLGGRVVREDLQSSMWGQPFEGLGHTGFDNVTGKFWSTWTDNMSTSLMSATGTCENGVCVYEGTSTDPLTGKPATSRMVSRHEPDKEIHEMFGAGPDGREFKMMELVYTRAQ